MTDTSNFLEERARRVPEHDTILTNMRLALRQPQPEPSGSNAFWDLLVAYHQCSLCREEEPFLFPFHYQDCKVWWRARPIWWRGRLRYFRWAWTLPAPYAHWLERYRAA
jgi:hypothetical protein